MSTPSRDKPDVISGRSSRDTVEDFVEELLEDAARASRERKEQARLNQLYFLGQQNQHIGEQGRCAAFPWPESITYRAVNLLRPAVNTQVARLLKALPDITAKPVTPDAVARSAAAIAADYCEYQAFEQDLGAQHAEVALAGFLDGTAGYRITYDPERDAISWDPITIQQLDIDPSARRLKDAVWCCFLTHVDKWSAHAMAEAYGSDLSFADIELAKYTPGVGQTEREGVEVREVWHRPTPRVPAGFRAVFIGSALVHYEDYPYMLPSTYDREAQEAYLPLVLWQADAADGSVWGSTPVDDAVVAQRMFNEHESRLAAAKAIACDVKLLGNEEVIAKWRAGKSQLIPGTPGSVQWVQPAPISSALYQDREMASQRILDLVGVSGLVSGQVNPKSGTSARSLAYIDELDSLKLESMRRSFISMLESGFELDLKLAQVFLTDERLVSLPSADGMEVKSRTFRGADLHGVTVRLEPRDAREKYAASKEQSITQEAQAQLRPVSEAQAALGTGLPESATESADKRIVAAELQALLLGEVPAFEADPATAVTALKEMHDLLRQQDSDPAYLEAVQVLAAQYAQRLQAIAAQQGPPPPAPAGGPEGNQ